MKKLLAILLAAMMVFALAACGNNETPSCSEGGTPATSQSGENNDGGEENNGGTTYDWPSAISSIKWTGSGNVVGITELTASQHGEVWIYIDVATLEEVGAYIEMLKGNGVSYWGEGDEPALAFENGEYNWAGGSGSIKIKLLEEPDTVAAVDGTYQLEIDIYADLF